MQQENANIEHNHLSDDVVESFLLNDPNFFERNAQLLANLHLPSPHGNGTISLIQRQQIAQRDKIRATEIIMAEMMEYGRENDMTSQKIHDLSLALLADPSLDHLAEVLEQSIKHAFSLAHVSLHLWNTGQYQVTNNPYFSPMSKDFTQWMTSLTAPYHGKKNTAVEILINQSILDEQFQSFALIPLSNKLTHENQVFGALILASNDQEQFHHDSGKLFLTRIGELMSVSIARNLETK